MVWILLFTTAEIDWLKIGAVCKDLPPDIWTQTTQTLLRLGLIRPNRQGTSYRLAPAGYELLDRIGFPYARDKTYRCDPAVIQRRVQTAELMLFLDRLGADVFLQSPADKKEALSFLPSAMLRQKAASNILGNTKLYGFLYAAETVFVPYRITEDDRGLYAQNEERIFHVNSLLCGKMPHVVYTGAGSLDELMNILTVQRPKSRKDHTDSYLSAMQRFSCPVCLVPLSDNGLRQLRIMTVPGYRKKLCRYLLGSQYGKPDNQWHDAVHNRSGERYQIGLGFNCKDFDKGLPKHLIVLDFQREAAQKLLTGQDIILHSIGTDKAEQILNLSEKLPNLLAEPYRTKEGRCLQCDTIIRPNQKG